MSWCRKTSVPLSWCLLFHTLLLLALPGEGLGAQVSEVASGTEGEAGTTSSAALDAPAANRHSSRPSRWFHARLALEGGYYHISFRGFDDHAASVASLASVSTDRLAATIKYLYTRYTLGTSDVDKHDIDSSLTFFVRPQLGLFIGFRAEIQQVRVASESGEKRSFGFNLYALPLGATASVRIPRTSLYVFGVGTLFVYAVVNQRSPRSDEQGFGGYALAGGVAYPMDHLLGLPLSVKLAYRFQNLEVGDFDEEVDQVNLGMTWQF